MTPSTSAVTMTIAAETLLTVNASDTHFLMSLHWPGQPHCSRSEKVQPSTWTWSLSLWQHFILSKLTHTNQSIICSNKRKPKWSSWSSEQRREALAVVLRWEGGLTRGRDLKFRGKRTKIECRWRLKHAIRSAMSSTITTLASYQARWKLWSKRCSHYMHKSHNLHIWQNSAMLLTNSKSRWN